MPTILKMPTNNQKGIMSFTHNEVCNGIVGEKDVKKFLENKSHKWFFGVHIQGDITYLKKWNYQKWQSFFLWPEKNDPVLKDIEQTKIINLNCINFIEDLFFETNNLPKNVDILIISRDIKHKNAFESFEIIKEILKKKKIKVVAIFTNTFKFKKIFKIFNLELFKDNTSHIDKRLYNLKKIFTSEELENISIINTSSLNFGDFALSTEFIKNLLYQSKIFLHTAKKEGGPRVIGEAIATGAHIFMNNDLQSGVKTFIEMKDWCTLVDKKKFNHDDYIKNFSEQIINFLEKNNKFQNNNKNKEFFFKASNNKQLLKKELENILYKNETNEWHLEDLGRRLCCHGKKNQFTINHNFELLKNFFDYYENNKFIDEQDFMENKKILDVMTNKIYIKKQIKVLMRKFLTLLKIIKVLK